MTVKTSAGYKVIPDTTGGDTEFADNVFRVQDNGDATKQFALEVSGVTTGTTRTATVPDRSFTLDEIAVGGTTVSGGAPANSILCISGAGTVVTSFTGVTAAAANVTVDKNPGVSSGRLLLGGLTSGMVTLSVADIAGTHTIKLPTADGSANQGLSTDGSGQWGWTTFLISGGALGTPSSGDASNLTGTASGLTVGNATNATNATTAASCSGNAATATQLQTSRTIGGSSFNGTANVTSFPSPGAIGGSTPAAGTFTTLETTSGQIQFPATQNPSANTHNLDDYEEGTWTVTATCTTSGTVTLTSTVDTGAYTKIGRMVSFGGRVTVDSVSSPLGNLRISLPFTSANLSEDSGRAAISVVITDAVSKNINAFCAYINEGVAYFSVFTSDSTSIGVAAAEMQAGTAIIFGGVYFTD